MILCLILTLIACFCYIKFEKVKCACHQQNINKKNPYFTLATAALVWCWLQLAITFWSTEPLGFISYQARVIIGAIAVILTVGFYVYILVFALPKGTYDTDTVQSGLATTGMYGMCRHPGFYGFTLTALAIGLLIGDGVAFVILCAHAALNLVYIILQDKYYFPVYLEGYDDYKTEVPFLAFWK